MNPPTTSSPKSGSPTHPLFGPDSSFQNGQVFASVGGATVNEYDPTSGDLLNSLVDDTGEPYTAGTAWDAQGNLYVADDNTGNISIFAPAAR